MPMPELEPSHDPYDWLEILRKEHTPFLDSKFIDEDQLLGLIQRLQYSLLGDSEENSHETSEYSYEDWALK